MSMGMPPNPSGEPAEMSLCAASVSVWSPLMTDAVIAVTMLPGEMALARTPCGASSFAIDLVSPMTPCLAAV